MHDDDKTDSQDSVKEGHPPTEVVRKADFSKCNSSGLDELLVTYLRPEFEKINMSINSKYINDVHDSLLEMFEHTNDGEFIDEIRNLLNSQKYYRVLVDTNRTTQA